MEQMLRSEPVPVAGTGRSIVRVRLQVPIHPDQQLLSLKPELLSTPVQWLLEINQKAPLVPFFAAFPVPIYDKEFAVAAEQMPD